MIGPAQIIDVQRLTRELPLAGIEHHEEIASTNDRALGLVRGEAPGGGARELSTPFLVIAEHQTAGRGRGANRWWSGDGALTFSLIVGPEVAVILEPANSPQLSLAAARAICTAIGKLLPGTLATVKPPNDVLVSGRKVCGVLIETPAVSPRRAIVGVGLNVNNPLKDAPPGIAAKAISLSEICGRPLDRTEVLIAVLREMLAAFAESPY